VVVGASMGTVIGPVIQIVFPGEQTWVPVPPAWRQNSVILPIILASGSIVASLGTESKKLKGALIGFGIVGLLAAATKALSPTAAGIATARALQQQQWQRRAMQVRPGPVIRPASKFPNGALTPTFQSSRIIRA